MTTITARPGTLVEGKPQVRLSGFLPFALVMVAMMLWGLAAMGMAELGGHYAFKALALLVIAVLTLQRANHLTLLMFLPFLWMPIKTAKYATAETHVVLPIIVVYVFIAWVVGWIPAPHGSERDVRPRAIATRGLYLAVLALGLLGFANVSVVGMWVWALCVWVMLGLVFAIALRVPLRAATLRRMFVGYAVASFALFLGWGVIAILGGGPDALYRLVELRTASPGLVGRYAQVALVVYGFSLAIAVSDVSRRTRYVALFCGILPAVVTIGLTLSKAGIATAPLVTVAGLLFAKRKRAAILVMVGLALAVGLFVLSHPGYIASVQERFARLSEVMRTRAAIRAEALRLCFQNPLWGLGMGQYRYHSVLGVSGGHNSPLTFAAQMGFPGLALYISLVIAVAYRLFVVGRRVRDPFRKAVLQGCRLVFLAMLATTQASDILLRKEAVVFAGFMGLAYAVTSPVTTKALHENLLPEGSRAIMPKG